MEGIPLTGGLPCFIVLRVKSLFVLAVGGVASLLLSSCGAFDSFGKPLGSDFDPLSAPGGAAAAPQGTAVVAPTYKSGQWVETAMANAAFFRVSHEMPGRIGSSRSHTNEVVSTRNRHGRAAIGGCRLCSRDHGRFRWISDAPSGHSGLQPYSCPGRSRPCQSNSGCSSCASGTGAGNEPFGPRCSSCASDCPGSH